MTQTTAGADKPTTPTQAVARQLKETRARLGLNAQQVADRCAEAGMPALDRSTIASIESGRRRRIGSDELLVLAYALDIAPVHLLVPRDDSERFRVTPEVDVEAIQARRWLRGVERLPGRDDKAFSTEIPDSEWQRRTARLEDAEEGYRVAMQRLAKAKELLKLISDDYGKPSPKSDPETFLESTRRVSGLGLPPELTQQEAALQTHLGKQLDVAYDRVAEATVEEREARDHLRRVRAEEGVT